MSFNFISLSTYFIGEKIINNIVKLIANCMKKILNSTCKNMAKLQVGKMIKDGE